LKSVFFIKKISYLQLLILHIAIAMIVYITSSAAKFFLLGAIVYFLFLIFKNKNKKDEVLVAAAYVMGFEVFSRMNGGIGLSYEFAKYSVVGFLLIGIFFRGFTKKSWPYAFFIIFLMPGILFSAINLNYESNFINAISFNLSGPICLSISALYCYDRKMPKERLQKILMAAVLPIISMTAYLYVYTPNIRDVLSGTQSNFEASGGFGPNQVATILGLGMFILFSRLLVVKDKLTNVVDLALLGFVSYRAMVTFSRGGVYTAGICAAIFLLVYFWNSSRRDKALLIPKTAIIASVIIITWLITSVFTLGLIDKRYLNQDAAGRKKEDISTGRGELLDSELEAFYEYPITGIGVGKAKEHRLETTGRLSATHNEVSRMLSEHGLFGLFALILLVITPLVYRFRNKTNLYLYSFFIFWLLTINHSSMRIAAPAFIYGLSLITIINERKKPFIHRK